MTVPAASRSRPTPKLGRRSTFLLVGGIGVAVITLILGSVALIESRHDTWKNARQNAGNLLIALDRDIARNVATVDLSLKGVVEALAEPGIDDVSPAIRQHALFDRSASAEDLGSLLVLDRQGMIVADSTSSDPHKINLADRDYFIAQRQDPARGLFISRAFGSRLAGGDPRIALSRALVEPGGTFEGVVLATIRLTFFQRLFEKLDLGRNGAITLLRDDGRLLFRLPMRPGDLDVDVSKRFSTNFQRFKTALAGQYVSDSTLDGVERLISFRHIGDLPLLLAVSISTDDILAPWWRKAVVIGMAMLLLCACAIASSVLFWFEMLRRTRTEQALEAANRQLAIQASTDALTGLLNRRAFDNELDRAFRTAIRNGAPVAVIMIDVDYFKRFNDTYGHVAGDEVLRAIAGCMRHRLRRPADCIARYGGEEFVAVLADTSDAAALVVADRIREGISALQIPHSASPLGTVSVSIGVASAVPLVGDNHGSLLELADRNLYAAKQGGRNRISAAHMGSGCSDLAHIVLAATDTR